jgi:hypothetical protein
MHIWPSSNSYISRSPLGVHRSDDGSRFSGSDATLDLLYGFADQSPSGSDAA